MKRMIIPMLVPAIIIVLALSAPAGKKYDSLQNIPSCSEFGPIEHASGTYDRISLISSNRKGPDTHEKFIYMESGEKGFGLEQRQSYGPAIAMRPGPVIMRSPDTDSEKAKNTLFSGFEDTSLDSIEESFSGGLSDKPSWGWLADDILSSKSAGTRDNPKVAAKTTKNGRKTASRPGNLLELLSSD